MKAPLQVIEASAGTGKTFRLAQEVLERVAAGVDVRHLVVVTFTEAATAELRERVRRRLRDARRVLVGVGAPDPTLARWAEQVRGDPPIRALTEALRRFDEAPIRTLHGFARRASIRAALPAGASLRPFAPGSADDAIEALILDFWTARSHGADPALGHLFLRGDLRVERLVALARTARDPVCRVVPPASNLPPPDLFGWRALLAALDAAWDVDGVVAAIDAADVVRRTTKDWPESLPAGRTADNARGVVPGAVSPAGPLPAAFAYFCAERLRAATRSGPPPSHPGFDALEAFARGHDAVRREVDGFVSSTLHAAVDAVRSGLPSELRRRGEVAFDELVRELHDAVVAGPARDAVRGDAVHALIDEFQDTDPSQWALFRTLFPRGLTVVGDPKQAIYGFRGADLHTYRRALDELGADGAAVETLGQNHRADGHLVAALDHLFGRSDAPFGPWPPYAGVEAALPPSRLADDDRPPFELLFLPRTERSSGGRRLTQACALDGLVEVVAADVVRELQRRGRIGGREIGPGDCAVLVRSRNQGVVLAAALRRRGVPAVSRADDSVWDSPVAGDLRALVSAVRSPHDDALRRVALAGPLLGRTAADLLDLDADEAHAAEVAARFRRWREVWDTRGFGAMAAAVMDDEGVLPRILAQDRGDRRAADLRQIVELCDAAAYREGLGPDALLGWLDAPRTSVDEARARLETDDPAVQVVTVHSAKGLQFPLVWVPWAWTGGFLSTMDQDNLAFHDEGGARGVDLGSPDRQARVAARTIEQQAEDLRLVYVALTRAQHRCVVGFAGGEERSPLGHLLGVPPTRDDDVVVRAALAWFVAHPQVGLREVDWDHVPSDTYDRAEPAGPTVRRQTRDAPLDRRWRRASFTGLVSGADGPHHEAASEAPAPPDAAFQGLRGGAGFGVLVHELLERHDFTDPTGLRELAASLLARHGRPAAELDALCAGVQGALDAPVLPAFQLRDLPRRRRLSELEFTAPLRDAGCPLTPASLAAAFRHPDAPPGLAEQVAALPFGAVHGLLVGSVDLVFEHDGRHHLVDWKTTWLGGSRDDYGSDALAAAMVRESYLLQLHLYAVALHRYLRMRVRGYGWDRHVGDALYLFLRGMSAGDHRGVFRCRPSAALVDHLDRALAGAP